MKFLTVALLASHARLSVEAIAPARITPGGNGRTFGTGQAPQGEDLDAGIEVIEEPDYWGLPEETVTKGKGKRKG